MGMFSVIYFIVYSVHRSGSSISDNCNTSIKYTLISTYAKNKTGFSF